MGCGVYCRIYCQKLSDRGKPERNNVSAKPHSDSPIEIAPRNPTIVSIQRERAANQSGGVIIYRRIRADCLRSSGCAANLTRPGFPNTYCMQN
jgi:hypothetical protein